MPKKILVVDDDFMNLKLIKTRLDMKGYESFIAPNGEEGLKIARSENPDAVILDVEMPTMDGYTFMNRKKEDESIKSIPVIILTAHEETQPIFAMKGVQGYLVKPIQFEKLFELLDKI